MRVITYNVNGIRAALKKGFLDWLKAADPDVLCLQETKAQSEQVEQEGFEELGYKYRYWFSAEKKGYSGVAIFSKTEPNHVEYGIGIPLHDIEGRVLRADFDEVSVFSMYYPSGASKPERQLVKYKFLDDFWEYLEDNKSNFGEMVLAGDFNICHHPIDIHNPVANKYTPGFLPQERAWLDKLEEEGFHDSFRLLNKEPHNYTWWSYMARARDKNLGWRIDYQFVTSGIAKRLSRAMNLTKAYHSDHCPVFIEWEGSLKS